MPGGIEYKMIVDEEELQEYMVGLLRKFVFFGFLNWSELCSDEDREAYEKLVKMAEHGLHHHERLKFDKEIGGS